MFEIDFVGVLIASLVEAAVFLMRLISVGFSIASTVQTTRAVDAVNKPVAHMQPTQPSDGSTVLGEQLPTEF
jgi:hypothetical protein